MEKFVVSLPEWAFSFFWFLTGFYFYTYGALLSFWRIRASERTGGLYPRPFRKFLSLCSWLGFLVGIFFYLGSQTKNEWHRENFF